MVICIFSDAKFGTLEPNSAGIVFPASAVVSPIASHSLYQHIAFVVVRKIFELPSPKVNKIGDKINPYEMHEIVRERCGKRERAQNTK